MAPEPFLLISKIIAHLDKIKSYSAGLQKEEFLADSKSLEACVFNLSQIGELAWRLTDDFRNLHSEIPWARIRGLRHRIVHDYEGVNLELIWDIVNSDLETLCERLKWITRGNL